MVGGVSSERVDVVAISQRREREKEGRGGIERGEVLDVVRETSDRARVRMWIRGGWKVEKGAEEEEEDDSIFFW